MTKAEAQTNTKEKSSRGVQLTADDVERADLDLLVDVDLPADVCLEDAHEDLRGLEERTRLRRDR